MKNQNTALSASEGSTSAVKEVLKARARALARPLAAPASTGSTIDVIEFNLAKERYAVEQEFVQEVHPLHTLTPLPCTPAFLAGVVNLRGQILPVIDIKKFFDLPDAGITDLHMVIVVRDKDMELGILADAVAGLRSIPVETLQLSLPTLAGIRAAYLKGVTGDRIAVLDVMKILADPKICVEENVDS
jgi:purine-binding chemotaxis protein CheW